MSRYTFTNQEVKVFTGNTTASSDITIAECPADEIWKLENVSISAQVTGSREVAYLQLRDPKTQGNAIIKNQTAAATLFWNNDNQPKWLHPGWKLQMYTGAGGVADGTYSAVVLIQRFKQDV